MNAAGPARRLAIRLAESTLGPPALLLTAAVLGMVWANLDTSGYDELFARDVAVGWGNLRVDEDIHGWINDGLMTLFFFAVGLEVKRELTVGELQDRRRAALPALAALGGMAIPAAIYLAINASAAGGDASGWAIPVATDIAFTLGALSLLGDRVPAHLRLFVLTLAIVDDIGGVLIIAVGFSDGISGRYLAAAAVALGAVVLQRNLGVGSPLAYVPLGVAAWYCTTRSGIEPTVAGVALGLLTPSRPVRGRAVLEELEDRLGPPVALVVLPVFALANTGIAVDGSTLSETATDPIGLGVIAGLVVGKTIGITAATKLALKAGIGTLHRSVSEQLIAPAAVLAGIGFTVALFVADLSFADPGDLDTARIGVLAGSLLAGTVGLLLYLRVHRRLTSGAPLAEEPHGRSPGATV